MSRVLAVLFLALACLLPVGAAHAHIGHEKQKLELGKRPTSPREGPRGRATLSSSGAPVRLVRAGDGTYIAGFELKNTGDGPLQVYRVAIRGAEDGGARPPVGLGIQTLPKATTVIRPGESRLYNVVWRPDQTSVSQAYGHVIIETDSAAPGAETFDPPIYLGIVADRRPAPPWSSRSSHQRRGGVRGAAPSGRGRARASLCRDRRRDAGRDREHDPARAVRSERGSRGR